jgi:putative ABC transport system permease protein
VFFVRYVRSELVRRRGRSILTVLGLALGVAVVIVVAALTRGLDRAQQTALDPLSAIGTDLTVTLQPSSEASSGFGPGGRGGNREVVQANSSVITDLSKLGKPGDTFVHDFFLPGTQLTFAASDAKKVSAVNGVDSTASGLILTAVHQSGTVPKIVAKLKAGGQQIDINREIPRPTQAEFEQMQKCLEKAGIQLGPRGSDSGSGTAPGSGGGFQGQQPDGGLQGPQPGANREGFNACLPERLRRFRATITTPEQTLRQVLDPPQTNISSTTYTIAGVDLGEKEIGVVTPSLVTKGRFLRTEKEALVGATYASRMGLKPGSTIDLNGSKFRVVGIVRPGLGGQAADVYIALPKLQALAGQKGMVNVVLVRSGTGADVAAVQQAIESDFPSASVASAKDVAGQITGSLVDAANLSDRLGVVLAVLAGLVAFLVAALLTLSSVGKRVREIGTLKALGWKQRLVVRQIVGESLTQGIAGGILGIAIGLAAVAAIGAGAPTLSATSTSVAPAGDVFGLGAATARTVSENIALTAPVGAAVLAAGLAVAVLGGLAAGALGGWRAARMQPADALRRVE